MNKNLNMEIIEITWTNTSDKCNISFRSKQQAEELVSGTKNVLIGENSFSFLEVNEKFDCIIKACNNNLTIVENIDKTTVNSGTVAIITEKDLIFLEKTANCSRFLYIPSQQELLELSQYRSENNYPSFILNIRKIINNKNKNKNI